LLKNPQLRKLIFIKRIFSRTETWLNQYRKNLCFSNKFFVDEHFAGVNSAQVAATKNPQLKKLVFNERIFSRTAIWLNQYRKNLCFSNKFFVDEHFARVNSAHVAATKKPSTEKVEGSLEVPSGFEPLYTVLQTVA